MVLVGGDGWMGLVLGATGATYVGAVDDRISEIRFRIFGVLIRKVFVSLASKKVFVSLDPKGFRIFVSLPAKTIIMTFSRASRDRWVGTIRRRR